MCLVYALHDATPEELSTLRPEKHLLRRVPKCQQAGRRRRLKNYQRFPHVT